MGKPKYYISCPISIDEAILKKYQSVLWHLGAEPISWERGTPYILQKDIDSCDGFVLILPEDRFNYCVKDLPIGCKRELSYARDRNKSIYLAYSNAQGPQIYQAEILNWNGDTMFQGIAQTQREVKTIIARLAFEKTIAEQGERMKSNCAFDVNACRQGTANHTFPPYFNEGVKNGMDLHNYGTVDPDYNIKGQISYNTETQTYPQFGTKVKPPDDLLNRSMAEIENDKEATPKATHVLAGEFYDIRLLLLV